MSGRIRFQPAQERAQPRLDALLGLHHRALQRLRDLLAQPHHFIEREAADHPRGDALRFLPGAQRGPGRGPLRGRRRGARPQADDPRQHLAGDARAALAHPVQDHLGQHHRGEVLSRGLVHYLDVVAGGDQAAQAVQGDVAAGLGVVQLAVPVPPHHPRPAPGLGHGRNITRCVIGVKGA
jgi:hypothetical protein